MSNPSKAKGTNAESAVVKWLHANGFPWATRQPLSGNRDKGDINLDPGGGVVIEVKAHKLATGYPTRTELAEWMRQTLREADNARADVGVLIVKRPGTTDVARWYGHITTRTFLNLLGAPVGDLPIADAWQMLPVEDLALLLRFAGYGTPTDKDTP